MVARHFAGDRVNLRVERGNADLSIPVTLGSMSDPAAVAAVGDPGRLGVLGISVDQRLAITQVTAGPAQNAGLSVGDTIRAIGGKVVSGPEDLGPALWRKAATPIQVQYVDSSGIRQTVTVTPKIPGAEDAQPPTPHM
jgi:S1-C subfamily serine protease